MTMKFTIEMESLNKCHILHQLSISTETVVDFN